MFAHISERMGYIGKLAEDVEDHNVELAYRLDLVKEDCP